MALSASGSISASQINIELGRPATAALSWNDITLRKLLNQTTGLVSLDQARGSTYVANTTNLNLFSLCNSPSLVSTYKFCIDSDRVVGGTGISNSAIDVGQFPSGSTVFINNYGSVLGKGGVINGGAGGDAIKADYASQAVVVNNFTTGLIYSGGGGGGAGGRGGNGGNGGQGTFQSNGPEVYDGPFGSGLYYVVDTLPYGGGLTKTFVWNGNVVTGPYYQGSFRETTYTGGKYSKYGFLKKQDQNNWYGIGQIITNFTSGGAGGAGGSGGNGGRGQGFDGLNSAGVAGAVGNSGGAGGTNAGSGGTGGTGGTGGSGAGWGESGSSGNNGLIGSTGASGNYTAGIAGFGGGGGGAGGRPGYYLVRFSNNVTINNNGGLAGGII